MNGERVYSIKTVSDMMKKIGEGNPVQLTIKRGKSDENITLTVVPRIPEGQEKPRMGILWDDRGVTGISHPRPANQIITSVATIWQTIEALISPKSEIKVQHLSGFVGIMRLYYMSFVAPEGWKVALWFSVVLNVNLAILNLLPIPPLDGGHILLSFIEAIRRRPIQQKILDRIQATFAFLVIGFMLYLAFYDIQDLPWKREKKSPSAEMKFSSPSKAGQ
jgi:regulator of sigma E protease